MRHALEVEQIIRAKLAEERDFARLASNCLGAFPSAVRNCLAVLAGSSCNLGQLAEAALRDARRRRRAKPFWDRRLPLPHPLDDDWRFSPATADRLLCLCLEAAGPTNRLLLAAVPTLVLRAIDLSLGDRIVFAARSDDPVTTAVLRQAAGRLEFRDIRADLRNLRCGAAICDPPWSDIPAQAIVRAAVSGVQGGRPVFVCVPDVLTGASQAEYLGDLPRRGADFGLQAVRYFPMEVRYETPLFELNALEADGIRNFAPDWRTGRLISGMAADDVDVGAFPTSEWNQRSVGSMRLFARKVSHVTEARSGFRVVPSISRTHPARASAIGWTSGNRATDAGVAVDLPSSDSLLPAWLAKLAAREGADAERLLRLDP